MRARIGLIFDVLRFLRRPFQCALEGRPSIQPGSGVLYTYHPLRSVEPAAFCPSEPDSTAIGHLQRIGQQILHDALDLHWITFDDERLAALRLKEQIALEGNRPQRLAE